MRQLLALALLLGVATLIGCSGAQCPLSGDCAGKNSDRIAAKGKVLPGIDILKDNDFDILQGKKVGLITNHTGISKSGESDIDILFNTEMCDLVALFSPEHGIRGTADEKVASGVDEKTGLPIHSLYGQTRKPTPEMLEGLDVLVFDIQDIGCRFYTYIATMAFAMEASKENNLEFVVLDRPNVIGGAKVEGAVAHESLTGINTCIYPIPTRHGMTVAELALLFNDHFEIGCDLEVVPMTGWHRSLYFDETGLAWKNPSPNMRTVDGAIVYPGLGMAETTLVSCGRGLDRPFEFYGAPYMDKNKVAANLQKRNTPGIWFVPASFTPTAKYHNYRGELCHGVQAVVYDRDALDSVTAGLHMIQAFYETHPDTYDVETNGKGFQTESGDLETWKMLTEEKMTPEEIVAKWQPDIEAFKKLSRKYYLYD